MAKGKSNKNERFRTTDSLKRPKHHLQPRESILIVCEGKETEPRYFRSFREMYKLELVEIEIIGEGAAPITVVDRAIEIQKEREKEAKNASKEGIFNKPKFDEVWCVFDREGNHQSPSFHPAVNKALANKLKLAISNPSFEFWFIIHFEQTTKPFQNADDVIAYLKKNHLPDYEKNSEVCNKIFHLTDTAINYSELIIKNHQGNSSELYPSPSTEVHLLIKKLKAMSNYGAL